MRTFGAVLLAGGVGFLSLKLLGGLVLPLLGLTLGFMGMLLKIAIIVAIGYFVLTLLRGRRRRQDAV
jgi:hypothetical protein